MYGIGDMCFGWNQIMCVLKIKEKGGCLSIQMAENGVLSGKRV